MSKLWTKTEIVKKLNSIEMEEARKVLKERRDIKLYKAREKKRLGVPPRPYFFDKETGPSHRIVGGKPVLNAPIQNWPKIIPGGTLPKWPPK